MFLGLFSPKRQCLFIRGFHLAKQFANPSAEDIIFKAICVNLRQKKWNLLDKMLPSLTSSVVSRVFHEFQRSPPVVLEFYNRIGGYKFILDSSSCCGIVIHVMVNCRKYDDALFLMKELMMARGCSPFTVLEILLNSYDSVFSRSAVLEALVGVCTQIGSTKGA